MEIVTSPDGKGVVLIGGEVVNDDGMNSIFTEILEMREDEDGSVGSWEFLEQHLKYPRRSHIVVPISDEMTTCN